MGDRIGLIAGNGRFPLLFAEEARRVGLSVTAVAHKEETLPDLARKVEKIFWIRVGQLGRLIAIFHREGISQVVMAGGIRKARFFSVVRPDLRSIRILTRVKERKDDLLLRAVAEELEKEGIHVQGATVYCPSLLAPVGVLTARSPTRAEWEDLAFGCQMAWEIGRLEIGQCVVVKERIVLSVEAIEGTDEAIRRGGGCAHGAVVVKVSKPQQDTRFDLPAVGPETIRVMKEVGATLLGVEAGRTILLEKEEVIKRADEAGIALVGVERGITGGAGGADRA